MQISQGVERQPFLSGQWISLVEIQPPVSYDYSEDEDVAMSSLLTFKIGESVFEGYYCSDSEMGWVANEDNTVASYDIDAIEYRR
ncbi:hypothetical protein JCM30760_26470 [Thiomicrorhabdus hydrogeniphila]